MADTNSVREHNDSAQTPPGVLLIGTLDTKGNEVAYVAAALERLGCRPIVLDSGVRGEPNWDGADYTRAAVATAGGATLEQLQELPRGDALAQMAEGVKAVALSLAEDGRIEGALCLAGAGVSLAVPAFEALGHGFPKVLVTPLASGSRRFDAFVGTADVVVMHSVADIMGINPVTEPVYLQAAGLVAGAVNARRLTSSRDGDGRRVTLVAASMNGKWDPLESTCRHASLSIL